MSTDTKVSETQAVKSKAYKTFLTARQISLALENRNTPPKNTPTGTHMHRHAMSPRYVARRMATLVTAKRDLAVN